MAQNKSETIKEFYKGLVGQTITVHLLTGETMNGVVLDVDAGDILLRRTGDRDVALISSNGFAAITAGIPNQPAGGQ